MIDPFLAIMLALGRYHEALPIVITIPLWVVAIVGSDSLHATVGGR